MSDKNKMNKEIAAVGSMFISLGLLFAFNYTDNCWLLMAAVLFGYISAFLLLKDKIVGKL